MQTYWMKFTDGSESHCEGQSAYDAVSIAEHLTEKTVAGGDEFTYNQDKNPNVAIKPYPANPMIWQLDHPEYGKTPTFCHGGKKCQGLTSCPSSYSCTE